MKNEGHTFHPFQLMRSDTKNDESVLSREQRETFRAVIASFRIVRRIDQLTILTDD